MTKRRWPARVALGLAMVTLVVFTLGIVRFRSAALRTHPLPSQTLSFKGTPTELARGEHLARTLGGCTECHGDSLAGRMMEDGPLMTLTAPNITPGRGSVVQGYRDSDYRRAILHGVDPRGKNLLVMPSKELRTFSEEDIAAIVAYVKSVPPVDRVVPEARVKLLGQVVLGLVGAELWPANLIDHGEARSARPTPSGATAEHGEYLIGVCKGCHGPKLEGGLRHGPDAPASADISARAMAGWTREQLEQLLRHGKRRDGTQVSAAMPWRALGGVTDEELTAMWLALRD